MRLITSRKKVKLTNGLINLFIPFGSRIEDSKKNIEIIGAISELPGLINQTDPKIQKIKGVTKNLINLFLITFKNRKQIVNRVK